MLTRGAIIENDSLTGYYFLYQGDPYDKKTNSYQVELYNKNLILADKASFLLEEDFEFVSANVVDKRAYIEFRNYHYGPKGEVKPKKVESKLLLFDIDKNKIYKEIILPKVVKTYKAAKAGMPVMDMNKKMNPAGIQSVSDNFTFYYLQNKKILDVAMDKEIKNKQILQLLDNNLDTIWKSWLNDDKYKICTVANTFDIDGKNMGILVRKGNSTSAFGGNINHDFRIFSLDKGNFIEKIQLYSTEEKTLCDIKSTFYNKETQEYVLAGNYLGTKDAFFGFNYESLGLFIIKINLSDFSKPIIDKKIYTWKKDFSYLGLDANGNLNTNNLLTVKKVIYDKGQVSLVLNLEHQQYKIVPPGTPYQKMMYTPLDILPGANAVKASLICKELNGRQSLSVPVTSEEMNPTTIIKNDICILTLTNKLDILKFDYIGGKKDFSDLKFNDSKYFLGDIGTFYYKNNGGLNILALFASTDNSTIKRSILVSMLYGADKSCKSDQIEVSDNATWTEYYPAKPGYIMIVEYFEKEKRLSQRVEKFNY